MNPSTVFLGLSLMSGVFPKVIPLKKKKQRKERFTIRAEGERNEKRGVRTTDVSPDIITDDQSGREKEPDHALIMTNPNDENAVQPEKQRQSEGKGKRTSTMLLTMKWLETTITRRVM